MPRYYFHVQDGMSQRDGSSSDSIGIECTTHEDVRKEAMRALPEIASDKIPGGSDERHFRVVARDEGGHPVYTATLSFVGHWLKK